MIYKFFHYGSHYSSVEVWAVYYTFFDSSGLYIYTINIYTYIFQNLKKSLKIDINVYIWYINSFIMGVIILLLEQLCIFWWDVSHYYTFFDSSGLYI